MLQLSDKDIETGKLISQEQLDNADLAWLKEIPQNKIITAFWDNRQVWLTASPKTKKA
ncbi:MAG: hypothetical protein JWR67_3251 [Mucilaginibacter sp.]|nr:hypothetical protein [Mucilaginibacter sp.]